MIANLRTERKLLLVLALGTATLLLSGTTTAINVDGQSIVFAPSASRLEYNFTTAHDFNAIDMNNETASFGGVAFSGNIAPAQTLRITLITLAPRGPVDFTTDVGANFSALWVNVSGLSNGKYAFFFNDAEVPGTRHDIANGEPYGISRVVRGSNDFKIVKVGFTDGDLLLLVLLGLLFLLLLVMGFIFEPLWHFLAGLVGLFLALQMWEMVQSLPLTGIMATVAVGVMLSGVFRPSRHYSTKKL